MRRIRAKKTCLSAVAGAGFLLAVSASAALALPPIAVHGDSFAIGSRIPMAERFWNLVPSLDRARWWNLLSRSYQPARPVFNDGVGGQTIFALRDKMQKDTAHRSDTTIIYDRRNDGESARDYVAALEAGLSTLHTRHFLILPQVPFFNKSEPDLPIMREIDRRVLARWPDNTFNPAERAAFDHALSDPTTRSDTLHRNAKGQAIEMRFIKAWLDARGW
jgi:hypothetical protein